MVLALFCFTSLFVLNFLVALAVQSGTVIRYMPRITQSDDGVNKYIVCFISGWLYV